MIKRLLSLSAVAVCVPLASAQTTFETNQNNENNWSEYGPEIGDWEFTLGGAGSNDEDFESGLFTADASLGNYVVEDLLVGLRQTVAYNDQNAGTDWNGATSGFAQYHFDFDRFRPFVGAAFGGLYGDSVQDTFFAGPEAGVKWYAKDDTFIFGRVAYEFLFDNGDEAEDNFDDGRFVYTLGIGFNF